MTLQYLHELLLYLDNALAQSPLSYKHVSLF